MDGASKRSTIIVTVASTAEIYAAFDKCVFLSGDVTFVGPQARLQRTLYSFIRARRRAIANAGGFLGTM
jgi:hypothetical protein